MPHNVALSSCLLGCSLLFSIHYNSKPVSPIERIAGQRSGLDIWMELISFSFRTSLVAYRTEKA
jgi:hypothetical protein